MVSEQHFNPLKNNNNDNKFRITFFRTVPREQEVCSHFLYSLHLHQKENFNSYIQINCRKVLFGSIFYNFSNFFRTIRWIKFTLNFHLIISKKIPRLMWRQVRDYLQVALLTLQSCANSSLLLELLFAQWTTRYDSQPLIHTSKVK